MPQYQYLYTNGSDIKEECSNPFEEHNDEDAIENARDFLDNQRGDIDEVLLVRLTKEGNGVKRLVANLHLPKDVHVTRYPLDICAGNYKDSDDDEDCE